MEVTLKLIRLGGFDHSDGMISKRCFRKTNIEQRRSRGLLSLFEIEKRKWRFNIGKLIRRLNRAKRKGLGGKRMSDRCVELKIYKI